MNKGLASVIVPVHNGGRFLADALKSIFQQDYPAFETIVVDDGSSDNTAEIARSFEGVRYLHQSQQGVAAARNTGIRSALGEFIAFLDADDLWTPNKLSIQVEYLLTHPSVGYVVAKERLFTEPGMAVSPRWKELFEIEHTGFFPSALVVRAALFEKVGLYNPDYRTCESADWFARAKDAGVQMAILPETLLYKRIHDSNLSHQIEETRSNLFEVLKASIDRQRLQKKEND
jgi:glycosyltransferase involved in cell wall biosynthesis